MDKLQSLKQMPARHAINSGEDAFGKILELPGAIATLRRLLKEMIAGPAFRGSQRSGQFLEFVIEQSIAGNFENLKERSIGVELFKREPSYDTGEDAIVRVTASDVRKRLLQHYGWFGTECEYRIELPLGSYIPRILPGTPPQSNPHAFGESALTPDTRVAALQEDPAALLPAPSPTAAARTKTRLALQTFGFVAALVLALTLGWFVGSRSHPARPPASSVAPWSTLFGSPGSAHLVTSDANINAVEGMAKSNLSLSDYANHKYIPEPSTLTPGQLRFARIILSADSSAATPDVPITAKVAQIAQTFSKNLFVQTARSFQLSFLNNNDSFIFLGSPRSNPWFSVFAGALDFQFVFQPALSSEYIRNLHPRGPEKAAYIPSANGGGTGYSYALIAFIANPDQNGEVLLLAGADGEATAAAGDFATDASRMALTLQQCGIKASGSSRHFEILLQTDTMAGVPRRTDVIACHLLMNNPAAGTLNVVNH